MKKLLAGPMAVWNFLVSTYRESLRVSWPTRAQTIRLSSVVLGVCICLGLVLTGLDYGMSQLLKLLIK